MEIDGSTLRLDDADLANSKLMRVRLPCGSVSGGLLIAHDESLSFVVFSDDALEVGDDLLASPARRLTVTYVQEAHMREQRVTVCDVRPGEADDGSE